MNEKTAKKLRQLAKAIIVHQEEDNPSLKTPARSITSDNKGRRANVAATFRGIYRRMKKDLKAGGLQLGA
jgi:hypothetical protein